MRIRLRDGSEKTVDITKGKNLIQGASFVYHYDALPMGDPDKLELLDLAFPAYLGAVPNFKRVLDIDKGDVHKALQSASELLRQIPKGLPLTDWPDTTEHRELLHSLFRATTGGRNPSLPGFGAATSTKMLHKKRPDLIPIVDRWQFDAWGAKTMIDVVFCIQNMLRPQVDEFIALRDCLTSGESNLPYLSLIRLYDIMFWKLSNKL